MSVVAVAVAWERAGAVDPGDGWLTSAEREVVAGLGVPKRYSDWRLGRWVAKDAVIRAMGDDSLGRESVEILAREGGGPVARILAPGSRPEVTLSLSHAGGVGFAAAALGAFRLGCDVEEVSPRSEAFVGDYLTRGEASWVGSDEALRDLRANLVWSAKESALKALGEGLRMDTRSVEVTAEPAPGPFGWGSLRVRSPAGDRFSGCWRWAWGLVWTVVADAAIALVLTDTAG